MIVEKFNPICVSLVHLFLCDECIETNVLPQNLVILPRMLEFALWQFVEPLQLVPYQ
jgi:hypothetical protein